MLTTLVLYLSIRYTVKLKFSCFSTRIKKQNLNVTIQLQGPDKKIANSEQTIK